MAQALISVTLLGKQRPAYNMQSGLGKAFISDTVKLAEQENILYFELGEEEVDPETNKCYACGSTIEETMPRDFYNGHNQNPHVWPAPGPTKENFQKQVGGEKVMLSEEQGNQILAQLSELSEMMKGQSDRIANIENEKRIASLKEKSEGWVHLDPSQRGDGRSVDF